MWIDPESDSRPWFMQPFHPATLAIALAGPAAQLRAVRALYQAMKGGQRIFYGHFRCWGLPDTIEE
jgi:hypothetical protein